MGRKKRPATAPPEPLELTSARMRELVEGAMERIVRFVETLPEQPLHAVTGGRKLARSLAEPLPEVGVPYDRLLRLLFGRVIPASLNTAAPGYLAYVPGGGLFHAAVADLIADATNRYVGVWQAAPGLVQLESNVIAWFASMVGMPEGCGGLLTTGSSMAALIAVITARRERLPPDFLCGVVYLSEEAHHSIHKAALLAGFLPERIRRLPVDEQLHLDVAALESAIQADREAGLTPCFVVGSAGTVGSGAVDDLPAIAEVATRHALWFHVDAAYGGFFALTDRGQRALLGIERADSVALDPHKGLFLPYGTGALLVRERATLERAHRVHAAYLPKMQQEQDLVDFCDLGPELSRDARGLRVWLPLKMHGAATFRAALDEKLDLARLAYEALSALPEIEALVPELSIVAWRWRPADRTPDEIDDANQRLIAAINQGQRVLLTGTTLHGAFYIRVCVLNFRTHRDHIDAMLEDIERALTELRGG